MLQFERLKELPRIAYAKSAQFKGERFDLGRLRLHDGEGNEPSDYQAIGEMGGRAEEVILRLIEKDAALFAELDAAAERPFSQLATPIQDRLAGKPLWTATMGHLNPLQQIAKLSLLRAVAAARLGDRQKARSSLGILFKCQDATRSEGHMMDGLVGLSFHLSLKRHLADILREDCLTDDDLMWLQRTIAKNNGFDDGARMFRNEMARIAEFYDGYLARSPGERRGFFETTVGNHSSGLDVSALQFLLPESVITRNKANSIQWVYNYFLVPVKTRDVGAMLGSGGNLDGEIASLHWFSFGSLYAAQSVGSWGSISEMILKAEADRRMTETAVALERYQRSNGTFPVTLDELLPDFLNEIPEDFIKGPGTPIGYERRSDGYRLSVAPIKSDSEAGPEFIR